MSVTALRGPVSHTQARPDAAEASARRAAPPPASPVLPPLVMRAISLAALCAFGAGHWMVMVEPTAGGRAVAAVVICLAAAGALTLARRAPRRRRAPLYAAIVVVGLALALLAGGLPLRDLRPGGWATAAAAISGGLDGLPGARVPYRGLDETLRLVIPLGGTVLALVLGLVAFWPRRGGRTGFPFAALVVGVALYAIPAVALILQAEFLRGALLTLLVLLFWRGERLPRREALAAGAVAAVAAVAALAVAPALDGPQPWFDYEDWAQNAAGARSEAFSWNHDYSALLWPRDGRELLRVKARQRAYWKAEDLDAFDGREWVADGRFSADPGFEGIPAARVRAWTQDIRVTVRNLRSQTLPVPGRAQAVEFPDRTAREQRPGIWSVGRDIRRGDAYAARAYVPQPSREELEAAGTDYPLELRAARAFTLPTVGAGDPSLTTLGYVPGFKAPLQVVGQGRSPSDGDTVIARTPIARTYGLSRRLLAGAATPYDYVKAVEGYLGGSDFTYSEAPPIKARTLDGFLFDAKSGFCQQYSGSMALLLRMGGVPARVVTGFAPGALNRRTDEFIVRDVDAHSWVEAYFPGVGWTTFDPTPSAAPPRSQAAPQAASAGVGDVRDLGTTRGPAPGTGTQVAGEHGTPWALIAGGGALLLVTGLGARALVRRRRRPRTPAVLELERALAGVGEAPGPGVTLSRLEARFARSPDALGYVRALRAQRFARAAAPPTGAQRRGLRRELARGRGPLARLRTWLALPPRRRRGRSTI